MAEERIKVVVEGENRSAGALRNATLQIGQLEKAVQAMGGSSNVAIGRVQALAGAFSGMTLGTAALLGVAGGLLAIGAAATKSAFDLANQTEELDRLSSRTQIAVPRLAAYKQILEEGGGSAAGLDVALTFLNRSIATQDPLLAKLGITTKDTKEAFEQLAGVLSKSSDTAKVTEVVFQLLGRGGVELVPHLKDIAENAALMEASLAKVSGGMNTQALPALRRLDQATDEAGRNWKGFMTSLGGSAAGPIASAIQGMNDFWAAVSGRGVGGGGKAMDEEIRRLHRMMDQANERANQLRTRGSVPAGDRQLEVAEAEVRAWTTKLAELTKLRSAATSDAERLREIHGDIAPDSLGGVDLTKQDKDKKTGPTEREKRLEKIIQLTGRAKTEAMAALAALEAMDKAKAKRELEGELEEAGFLLDPDRALQVKADLLEIGNGWQETARLVDEAMKATDAVVTNSTQGWLGSIRGALNESLAALVSFRSVVETLLTGVDRGIKAMVMGFTTSAQTLKGAWSTIMQSIRDQALQVIAEIISAMVQSGILKLIGFFLQVPTGFNMGPGVPVGPGGVAALAPVMPEFAAQAPPVPMDQFNTAVAEMGAAVGSIPGQLAAAQPEPAPAAPVTPMPMEQFNVAVAEIGAAISSVPGQLAAAMPVPTFEMPQQPDTMGPTVRELSNVMKASRETFEPVRSESKSAQIPTGPAIGTMNVNALEFATVYDSMNGVGGAMRRADFRTTEVAAAHS